MIELELKAVVPDYDGLIARLAAAGARSVLRGRLLDRRYDFPDNRLFRRDEVVRLRVYEGDDGNVTASLEWKGPVAIDGGYKRREEIGTDAGDPSVIDAILSSIGLQVVRIIDRRIDQFTLVDATVRLERYHRMDDLVEVEGDPGAIERAIAATGIPREAFSADALSLFAQRYERRTGQRAMTGSPGAESDAG